MACDDHLQHQQQPQLVSLADWLHSLTPDSVDHQLHLHLVTLSTH